MKTEIMMKKIIVIASILATCSMAGTLKDSRDGQTYKTVKIGDQTWMAENLNYKTSGSACYDSKESNCEKYGRLYTWESAKKACPAGWHLPNSDEWSSLWDAVGGVGSDGSGTKLMSKNGWDDGNGSDSFGFAVLPAGGRFGSQDFLGEGVGTQFWMFHAGFEIFWVIMKDGKVFRSSSNNGSNNAWSVRCLQDPNEGDKASLRKASLSENEEKKSSIGTLKDSRDGKTYKTVKIGEQVWMAENLNVNVPGSMCYDNNPANCNKYGRLYTWAAAMDSAGMVDLNSVGKGCGFGKECRVASVYSKVLVRGVCPEGWHLPRHDEWEILRRNVDVAVGNNVQITSTAGNELRSKSGWVSGADGSSGNGSDSFGFAVLPAGYFENDWGKFVLQSSMALFWSSEEGSSEHARGWMFNSIISTFGFNSYSKGDAFSVRCLQDPNEKNRASLQHSQTQPSKIVKIGDQVWMAENLNVETEKSWCFNNDPANCEKYGRLYAWEVAKEICPSGWRLPRKKDFKILLNKVGSSEQERSKNLRTTSWNNGTDKYGFSVLPAGVYGFNDESFTDLGGAAFFWSSAEDHSYLIVGDNSSYINYRGSKNDGLSVRCIQDN